MKKCSIEVVRVLFLAVAISTASLNAPGQVNHSVFPEPPVAWRFSTGLATARFAFAPDKTIYIAVDDGPSSSSLTAVTPEGKPKWSIMKRQSAFVTGPAVAPSGVVYALYRTESSLSRLVAISPVGKLLWSANVLTQAGLGRNYQTPAIVAGDDGSIYISASDLYAFSSAGSLEWRYHTGAVFSPVRLTKEGIRTVSGANQYLLSATGKKLSQTPRDDLDSVVDSNGMRYALRGMKLDMSGRGGNQVVATRPDGTQAWSYATGKFYNGIAVGPDHHVYASGSVTAAWDSTGKLQWELQTNPNVPPLLTHSGTLIAGCSMEADFCAYTQGGKLRWALLASKTPVTGPRYGRYAKDFPAVVEAPGGILLIEAGDYSGEIIAVRDTP